MMQSVAIFSRLTEEAQSYDVILSPRQPRAKSRGFLLSEHLNPEEILTLPNHAPRTIGEIELGIFDPDLLSYNSFYPFSRPKFHSEYIPSDLQVLLGKGIADRIQYLITKDLNHKFQGFSIINDNPSNSRKRQERRLGITPYKQYPPPSVSQNNRKAHSSPMDSPLNQRAKNSILIPK